MEKVGAYTDRVTESGEWRPGNPATGQQATPMLAAYFNMLQRELVGVVEGADIELDPEDDGQILQALNVLIDRKVPDKLFLSFSVDTVLTAEQMGLLTLDASGGDRVFTLPDADESLGVVDVVVRRLDNSGNRLRVQAAGTNKIKFHTHLNTDGYPFLVLMGAGDWWHLRSDGEGGWWPIGRFDSTPLGRPVFDTTTAFPPGGYGALSGPILVRADWPWVWDHAQQSGMLTTEAGRAGMEGGWTSGDGVATLRGPEGRGEFLRIFDEGRGVDAGRGLGSSQSDAFQGHLHGFSDGHPARTRNASDQSGSNTTGSRGNVSTIMDSTISDGVNGAPRVAPETRPRNIAYPGRIKLI